MAPNGGYLPSATSTFPSPVRGPSVAQRPVGSSMERKTLRGKLVHAWRNLTVEPLLACYLLPSALTALAVDNLNLEKACRVNLRYNATVCDALTARLVDDFRDQDIEAQRLVTQMAAWRNALRASLPALLALFVGSWSDRRARRKPLLLVPLAGELVTCGGLLLCTRFFAEWPLEVAGAVQGLFTALSGGAMVTIMAVFSYVGDVTSEEDRTFRIGVVNMCVFLCVPLGTALSGVLFKQLGFYGMFSLAAALYALGLVYGAFFLKEAKTPVPRPPDVGFARDFFDPRHVVETFSVALKRREDSRRLRLLLLIVLFVLVLGPSFGERLLALGRFRCNLGCKGCVSPQVKPWWRISSCGTGSSGTRSKPATSPPTPSSSTS